MSNTAAVSSVPVNARLFVEANVGRGLLTSLAIESACFAVAGREPVVGAWPAWRATDDRFIREVGE